MLGDSVIKLGNDGDGEFLIREERSGICRRGDEGR